jgi:small nuclear ribonucleoprotein D3
LASEDERDGRERETMSVSKGVGIPVKLLHEAEGHIVTIELKTGETFRGKLRDTEDNWNCQIENVTATARDGRVTHLGKAFIRGSKIRYVVAPDMLKNAPIFKRIDPKMKGKFQIGTGGVIHDGSGGGRGGGGFRGGRGGGRGGGGFRGGRGGGGFSGGRGRGRY